MAKSGACSRVFVGGSFYHVAYSKLIRSQFVLLGFLRSFDEW
ncbi:hypothetical protein Pan181_12170 [Aeoliella mucimassa]|uniref:Uncharacterized protein n=1 Tax=Aeoliella mucimassa TaxID=2527972 RepID=A0A518AJX9_9BACT|nr:hypothetical protein Pan181_12170 [Aeoliella mucimassa]